MSEHNAVVGVYDCHTEAEAAIKELQKSGFDMHVRSTRSTVKRAFLAG